MWLPQLPWSGLVVRARLVAACVAGAALFWWVTDSWGASPYVPLPAALSRFGLEADEVDGAAVLDQRRGGARQLLVFRASRPGELADIWLAEGRVSRQGVTELSEPHNLTLTASAEEHTPVVRGRWALFFRVVEDEVTGFEVVDLAPTEAPAGWMERLQQGVRNFQQTGRLQGVFRRTYTLAKPARDVHARWEAGRFELRVEDARVAIDPARATPLAGASLVSVRGHVTAVTELVPWLVDRARALSWVGPERIAWLENKVFALRDRFKQAYHSVGHVDHASEAVQELGVVAAAQAPAAEEKVQRLSVPDLESGWPPAKLGPLMPDPVEGEGTWRAIVDDPHVRSLPDGGPVFYQTFLRADPARSWARVYLTLWDPRIVQLHIVSGTEEPISATGETGSGSIPKDPETLGRLVGAFNGGFQAVHGEFGMMAGGRVYLPPKPWAATVAVYRDGRVGMGSWPGPANRREGYDEARAVAEIPAEMVAFRQNLTSLVEDGRFNPWQRWWWGAAPKQHSEQTLTQRSALCLTEEGFMLYAWGDSASPEALGAALVAARCARAMHLDMNAGHAGMELYHVLLPGEQGEPPGPRASYRHEGALPGRPEVTVRARRAVTAMAMPLPRYIRPDPRDFFYLTLKPGIETEPGAGRLAQASSADLPHAGWPPAFARHQDRGTTLLRIDPARAVPTPAPAPETVALAELRVPAGAAPQGEAALYRRPVGLGLRYAVGAAPADAEPLLRGPLLSDVPHARAAIGVDASGLLVYAETEDPTPSALQVQLAQSGVETALALPPFAELGLHFQEGILSVDGCSRVEGASASLIFAAQAREAAEVIFRDTAPMPYLRWAALQDQRVRYFRTKDPTSRAPASAFEPVAPPRQDLR